MGDCILWTGRRGDHGYGLASHGRLAHRVAYEEAHGPIPPGLCICHTCDVRLCVNTEHMFLGTRSDNNRDMFAKGRDRNGTSTKLTREQVDEIRSLDGTYPAIAARYGVSSSCIGYIKRGQTWQ